MKGRSEDRSRGPSQRQLRVAESIRHALAGILQRETMPDPKLDTRLITVPEVRLTADLKLATCYIMPRGGKAVDEAVAALERHKKFLRGALARHVTMKYVPDLTFRRDDSFERGYNIDRLLMSPEVQRDVKAAKTDEKS